MWKHDDKIHVKDPTLNMRIVKVYVGENSGRLMREEMNRVARKKFFEKIFGEMRKLFHLCVPKG